MSTRYRIIEQPSFLDPGKPVYQIQRRVGFWWEYVGCAYESFEEAKGRIDQLKAAEANPVKKQIIYVDQ